MNNHGIISGSITAKGNVTGGIRIPDVVQGPPGPQGDSPYIGENGNWWVGDIDTGVNAVGHVLTGHGIISNKSKIEIDPAVVVEDADALTNMEIDDLIENFV